jgi:hypothetical protein
MRSLAALAALLLPVLAASCASAPRTTTVETPAGAYARAFDAAKDELRDAGFELDRVDAREGVITTRPRASAGLWTPWTLDEQSAGDEIDGTFNAERRIVTVRFGPVTPAAAGGPTTDLRTLEGPLTARVEVAVHRLYRPGRIPESAAIRLTGYFRDDRLWQAGVQPDVTVAHGEDAALAAALAHRISSRVSAP